MGMAFSFSTTKLRRFSYSARIISMSSCGPASAAMPAIWVKEAEQPMACVMYRWQRSASDCGIVAWYPDRAWF